MLSDDFLIVLHVIINIIKRIINCSASTLSIKISGNSFPLRIRTYKLKIFIFIEELYEFVRERIDLVPITCHCFKGKDFSQTKFLKGKNSTFFFDKHLNINVQRKGSTFIQIKTEC